MKIDRIISNIYVYKFPPILNWPDGAFINIPVDFIIAIRKVFEHTSEVALDNINEICFSLNTEYSSYGDKILIIPIEYISASNSNIFLDTFAHEIGHSVLQGLSKDKYAYKQSQIFHKILSFYSLKFGNLFYDSKILDCDLARYQLEDYKEFIAEMFSQILNYFDDLIIHICSIKYAEPRYAYLRMVNMLLKYADPFSREERDKLLVDMQ